MEIYAEWPIVHSDGIGLEARQNPRDPEEYGIGPTWTYKGETIPLALFPRGSLKEVSTGDIIRTRVLLRGRIAETGNIDSFAHYCQEMGGSIDILALFATKAFLELAQKGKVMIR